MLLFFADQGNPIAAILIIVVMVILWGVSLALYVLPSIIAIKRGHLQMAPIILINLLAGWTFIGWVIAIVWSVSHQEPRPMTPQPVRQPVRDYNYKKLNI